MAARLRIHRQKAPWNGPTGLVAHLPPYFRAQIRRFDRSSRWSCFCPSRSTMKLSTLSFPRIGRRRRRSVVCAALSVAPRQIIAVVGSPELRPPLEDVVGPGAYEVMFIESIEGAHSQIAQTRPDRVILCCDVDDPSGFQLLSML